MSEFSECEYDMRGTSDDRPQRDPILELLDKLDEMYGPLTDEEIELGRREWDEMSKRLSSTLEPSSGSPETSSD